MVMYFGEGRCMGCSRPKKVLKFNSPTDMKGLCRKCLKELSEHRHLK